MGQFSLDQTVQEDGVNLWVRCDPEVLLGHEGVVVAAVVADLEPWTDHPGAQHGVDLVLLPLRVEPRVPVHRQERHDDGRPGGPDADAPDVAVQALDAVRLVVPSQGPGLRGVRDPLDATPHDAQVGRELLHRRAVQDLRVLPRQAVVGPAPGALVVDAVRLAPPGGAQDERRVQRREHLDAVVAAHRASPDGEHAAGHAGDDGLRCEGAQADDELRAHEVGLEAGSAAVNRGRQRCLPVPLPASVAGLEGLQVEVEVTVAGGLAGHGLGPPEVGALPACGGEGLALLDATGADEGATLLNLGGSWGLAHDGEAGAADALGHDGCDRRAPASQGAHIAAGSLVAGVSHAASFRAQSSIVLTSRP